MISHPTPLRRGWSFLSHPLNNHIIFVCFSLACPKSQAYKFFAMDKNRIKPQYKKHLQRAVTVTITLKIIGILVLFFLAFSPAHRPTVNSNTVGQHLFNQE
jgi:Trk-type K+ transport system membrane component